MKILVLDTIHGGTGIGEAYAAAGHEVDLVDVYRESGRVGTTTALGRTYDLVAAPVHLDPDHPLVRSAGAPVISHHDAVRMLLPGRLPHPMVEITGKRGKTTTAHALATLMPGTGIVLSSRGLIRYPGQEILGRMSITPASVLPAARRAGQVGGWLIAEESLGVSGAGDLAILTSGETYRCAAGKRDALEQKIASLRQCRSVLLAPGISSVLRTAVRLEEAAAVTGTACRIETGEMTGSFCNDLLLLEAYRVPLMLAGTAACLLGLDPSPLSRFTGLPGRMAVTREGGLFIVDNANSGTDRDTAVAAARFARERGGADGLTLVIGSEPGDGKVCEGFPDREIAGAIGEIRPDRLVLVGPALRSWPHGPDAGAGSFIHRASSLAEGRETAVSAAGRGSIVLAVKTWR